MRRQSIRKRLALIESRSHHLPISVEELARFLIGAPPEVISEMCDHPLVKSFTPDKSGSADASESTCAQCGHLGPFSEIKPATTFQHLTSNRNIEVEPITVLQMNDAFNRATPTILDDALCIAEAQLDRTAELMKVDCLVCGYSKLHIRVQPPSEPFSSASKQDLVVIQYRAERLDLRPPEKTGATVIPAAHPTQ